MHNQEDGRFLSETDQQPASEQEVSYQVEDSAAYLNIVKFIDNLYRIRNLRIFLAQEKNQLVMIYPGADQEALRQLASKARYGDPVLSWVNGASGFRLQNDPWMSQARIDEDISDLEKQQRLALPYSASGKYPFAKIAPDLMMCELEYPELFGYRPEVQLKALQERVQNSEGALTDRDVIWVLLSFPQTADYGTILTYLTRVKQKAKELNIPDYYLNGFVSSQTEFNEFSVHELQKDWQRISTNKAIVVAGQDNAIVKSVNPSLRTNESYLRFETFNKYAEEFSAGFDAADREAFSLFYQAVLFFVPAEEWPTHSKAHEGSQARFKGLWLLFQGENQYADVSQLPKESEYYSERRHIHYVINAETLGIPEGFALAFVDVLGEHEGNFDHLIHNTTRAIHTLRLVWQMWSATRNIKSSGSSILHLALGSGDE